jgi:hypothetical protein
MQELDRALLLLALPIFVLVIFALRSFVQRRRLELSLFVVGIACLVSQYLLLRQDDRGTEIAVVVSASLPPDRVSPVEERSGPSRGLDRWTAVYDISAHTVYLPNGVKLEAHSGLGARLDDPRYVHERMRGATPPNVYELALREKLFHGVRALRLKPLYRDKVFGRAGLLAHTYMLGPKGDSNGCVVFKNYDAFLQAYDAGELKRLAVVARLDAKSVQLTVAPPPSRQEHREPGARVAASKP